MIAGLQKMTLLDYPGKVACTVFLQGCNFRCPFCHNSSLLGKAEEPPIPREELMAFLKKRVGLLDGVCITGGEPTLQKELPALLRDIKALGYAIKLDTNGYRPDVLRALVEENLIDYVAMDIKNCPRRYGETAGLPGLDLSKIEESMTFLIRGTLPYEFRTTVTAQHHTPEDMKEMGYAVKLDTNGTSPEVLRRLIAEHLVDYVAMDIKNCREKYGITAGKIPFDLSPIEESVKLLMSGSIPYEFRTTTVRGIHSAADFRAIGTWIAGAERYFLQGFVDSGSLIGGGFEAFTPDEMKQFLAIVRQTIPNAQLRGID